MNTAGKGKDAESLASDHLQAHGLSLLQCNYRCRHGEIDLIMHDRDCLVFIEVRYRRRPCFGSGAESVDHRKQSRITASAQHYLQRHPQSACRPCRFDVVAIGDEGNAKDIQWIQDAFPALI